MLGFILILIVLIIIFVFLPIIVKWKRNQRINKIGAMGELCIANILKQLPADYTIINNLVLKTDRGTTQIDHIVVSKHGVFVIETKNYRGDIYGNDRQKEWKQIIVTPVRYDSHPRKTYTYVTKNFFYNPVKQSLGHMYAVKDELEEFPHLPIIPIVVFAGEANLSNVTSKYHVIFDNELVDTIKQYQSIYLSDKGLENVLSVLQQKNISNEITTEDHVKNIRKAHVESLEKAREGICPWCGGQLIKRTGPYKSFFGCSNYPKCHYMQKI